MGKLTIECETGGISDGYHTFDELYEHRCSLFIALMRSNPKMSWRAYRHSDGSLYKGWFIGGMNLPTGQITYHLPIKDWSKLDDAGIELFTNAPAWDGHKPQDVVDRLAAWIRYQNGNEPPKAIAV